MTESYHSHPPATIVRWLERILGHEGGFTNNAQDPGNWTGGGVGLGMLKGTKWGISASTYPGKDIKNLTVWEAAELYKRDFLDPLKADRYEDGVAFQLLDYAINSGPTKAIKALQRAVGVKDDGKVGPVTLSRLEKYSEAKLIMLILAERLEFMSSLSHWSIFSVGWAKRIANNLKWGARDL